MGIIKAKSRIKNRDLTFAESPRTLLQQTIVRALFHSHDSGSLLSLDTLDGGSDCACDGGRLKLRRDASLIALLPRCCQRDPCSVRHPFFLAYLKGVICPLAQARITLYDA